MDLLFICFGFCLFAAAVHWLCRRIHPFVSPPPRLGPARAPHTQGTPQPSEQNSSTSTILLSQAQSRGERIQNGGGREGGHPSVVATFSQVFIVTMMMIIIIVMASIIAGFCAGPKAAGVARVRHWRRVESGLLVLSFRKSSLNNNNITQLD